MNKDEFVVSLLEEYQETLEEASYRAKNVLYNFKRRNDDDFHRRMYRNRLKDFARIAYLLHLESDQLSRFLSIQDEKYDE